MKQLKIGQHSAVENNYYDNGHLGGNFSHQVLRFFLSGFLQSLSDHMQSTAALSILAIIVIVMMVMMMTAMMEIIIITDLAT